MAPYCPYHLQSSGNTLQYTYRPGAVETTLWRKSFVGDISRLSKGLVDRDKKEMCARLPKDRAHICVLDGLYCRKQAGLNDACVGQTTAHEPNLTLECVPPEAKH
jgi:hypothetical protein